MKRILFTLLAFVFISGTLNAQMLPYSGTLDTNNVSASVFSNGNYFWDLMGMHQYTIPAGSGKGTMFALSPWIGGYDADDSLHLAAMLYDGQEFLPGPIVNVSNFNDTVTANEYNKIWRISKNDITNFKNEWDAGNVSNGSYNIPNEILTWPGDHPTIAGGLAPYFDYDADGNYDPLQGDYPEIQGDLMLWWVYNDNTTHGCSGGKALGVEIRVSFYAYSPGYLVADSIKVLNDATFFNFEIVNRSQNKYDSTIVSLFADFDIGYAYDDYIGCNVALNSFYGYNGLDVDGSGEWNAYGGPTPPPPAQSITLLKGPEADENDGIDNDMDGTIDETDECIGLSSFMYFNNSTAFEGNPTVDSDFYNYMNASWRDGTHMVFGGNGHLSYDTSITHVETSYAFPAESDPMGWGQGGQVMSEWSEHGLNNPEGDRRGIGSSGIFTFSAGESISLDYVLNFNRSDTGNAYASVLENYKIIQDMHTWYNGGGFPGSAPNFIQSKDMAFEIALYPNPASNQILIRASSKINRVEVYNITGQVLLSKDINSREISLNVSALKAGTYLVKVSGDMHSTNKRLIIID